MRRLDAAALVRDGIDLLKDVVDYIDDNDIEKGILKIVTVDDEIIEVRVKVLQEA